MKKMIIAAAFVVTAIVAAAVAPSYTVSVKVTEKTAVACEDDGTDC